MVVVDDSIVRGTTSTSLVKFIRGAGAAEVHFRVASPPVRFPCYYGIDMPSKEELMGSRMSVDEIAADLGVDSLGYLSLDGMVEAVEEGGRSARRVSRGSIRRRWWIWRAGDDGRR